MYAITDTLNPGYTFLFAITIKLFQICIVKPYSELMPFRAVRGSSYFLFFGHLTHLTFVFQNYYNFW